MVRLVAAALLGVAFAACGAASPAPGASAAALVDIDESFEPLRERFNRDVDRRRLVIAVAPTCEACLEGVEAVRKRLLTRLRDAADAADAPAGLRVYVVWMPILSTDNPDAAARASASLPADRVTAFWDRRRWLGEALGTTLQLPPDALAENPDHGLAWDVYLLYDRGQRWDDGPPAPSYWMQRLEGARGLAPTFDADTLTDRVFATDW